MNRKKISGRRYFFRRKEYSLQKKVILIYMLMAVLPIILISATAYFVYYRSVMKEAYALVEQNTKQHEIVVNERLNTYQSVMYELVTDQEFIGLTHQINDETEKEKIISKWNVDTIMRNYVYTYDGIRSIAFIAQNNDFVGYSKWYSSINEVIWSVEKERQKLYEKVDANQGMTYIPAVNLANGFKRTDYVIVMGFPVRDLMTKQQTGILLIALDTNILNFDGKSKKVDVGEREKTGVSTLIVDEQKRIMAGEDSSYATKNYQTYLDEAFPKNSSLYQVSEEIGKTGWQIINVIDQDVYLKNIYIYLWIVVVVTLGITMVFFLLVFLISRKYIGTVSKIAKGIGQYAGTEEAAIHVEVDKKDELYVIARQFNQMTRRVNTLVDTLKHKNREIQEAVTRQKNAEIKALEAQINPHFLYNTLDSINWRAIEHEEEEISDMLGALGSLLRYSVSNIDSVVLMEAEISWLRKYVFLQRDRFNYSFDCSYEVEEDALGFPIYKMLMQPIIENAILHAFEDVKEGGIIDVKAYIEKDERLYLRIRDNGSGMTDEQLIAIRREITEGGPLNSESIGISNVINRLRIYYHGEAELQVESVLGEGTTFLMILPPVVFTTEEEGVEK